MPTFVGAFAKRPCAVADPGEYGNNTTDERGMYHAVFGETAPEGEYTFGARGASDTATAVART